MVTVCMFFDLLFPSTDLGQKALQLMFFPESTPTVAPSFTSVYTKITIICNFVHCVQHSWFSFPVLPSRVMQQAWSLGQWAVNDAYLLKYQATPIRTVFDLVCSVCFRSVLFFIQTLLGKLIVTLKVGVKQTFNILHRDFKREKHIQVPSVYSCGLILSLIFYVQHCASV